MPTSRISSSVDEIDPRIRVTFVQFGDYFEASERFAAGGTETFGGQTYSVEFVARLAQHLDQVSVISCGRDYAPRVSNAVRCRGVQVYPYGKRARYRRLLRAVQDENPTHVIARSPILPLLAWAHATGRRLLPLLADSFRGDGFKQWLKSKALAWMLNRPRIGLVSNHGLSASLDLLRIGVDPSKIVPFDWPATFVTETFDAKRAPSDGAIRLLYVGSMVEAKGVADCIRAVALLRQRGHRATLTLVGEPAEAFHPLIMALALDRHIRALGQQPRSRVLRLMNEHNLVLIPTHHRYPEGLPKTIYEGLCSRSPIVASDHPMFGLKLVDGKNCVIFEAGSVKSLANAILRAMKPSVYEFLSRSSEQSKSDYLCPVKWADLINAWLRSKPEDYQFFREFSLSNGPYYAQVIASIMTARGR